MSTENRQQSARDKHASPVRDAPASWRGGRTPVAASAGRSARTAWWRAGGSHERMKHTTWLIVLFGTIIVLGMAWYLIWQGRTQTPLVALVIADYRSAAIPPNAMAQEDSHWFETLWARQDETGKTRKTDIGFWGDAGVTRCEGARQCLQHFTDRLADPALRLGGPDTDTVLLYISAHGVVNSQGTPCLLLSDSTPQNEQTWMPLRDLLAAVRACLDAREDGIPPAKIILFLDASRTLYCLPLGIVYNAFNEQVAEAVQTLADPRLAVVMAAQGGEVSWPAPEYGRTIFGHFVGRGLSGLVVNQDDDDNIVSLGELADYVSAEVPTWVRTYRAAAQHPQVITTADESTWRAWRVAWSSARSQEVAAATTKLTSPPRDILTAAGQLDALWQRYDEVVTEDTAVRAPLELAELQFQLVKAEQLLLAGQAYRGRLATACKNVEQLLNTLAVRSRRAGPTELNAPGAAAHLDANQLQAFDAAWQAMPDASQWKEVAFPRQVVATGLVQWLAARQGHLTDLTVIDNVLALIDKAPATVPFPPAASSEADADKSVTADPANAARPELVEVHFLRMLQKHLDRDAVLISPAVEEAIRTRCMAEQAATFADPRVHYWVRERVHMADEQRRLAEDRLLVATPRAIEAAAAAWTQLAGPDGGLYTLAEADARELARAYLVRDSAWSRLPHLAHWLMVKAVHRQGATGDDFRQLTELAEQVHQLATLLDSALPTAAVGSDPDQLASSIEERSQIVRQILPLRDAIAARMDASATDYRATWEEQARKRDRTVGGLWADLLQIPLADARGVPGRMRGEQRRRFLDLLFASDDTSELGKLAAHAPRDVPAGEETTLLDLLAQVPVHPARALLRRQQLGWEGEPAEPTLEGNTTRDKILFLAAQSQQLRQLLDAEALFKQAEQWVGKVESDIATHSDARRQRLNVSRADRLLRAAAGLAQIYAQVASRRSPGPAEVLANLDRHYYFLWHGHRALLDLWSDERSPQGQFYVRAFEEYCDAAQAAFTFYERPCQYDGVDLEQIRDGFIEQFDARQSATPAVAGQPRDAGASLELDVTVDTSVETPPAEPFVTIELPSSSDARRTLPAVAPTLDDTPARRVGIPLGPSGPAFPLQLRLEKDRLGNEVTLLGTGFFRGRARISRITVPNPQLGEEVVIQRQETPLPTVRVTGASEKKAAIMFVVDCSYSMSYPLKDEGSRLRVATRALESILSTLAENQEVGKECRVGLLTFSHRVGYASERSTELVQTKAYQQYLAEHPTESSRTPDDDLEMIVPFDDPRNPLDKKLKQQIVEKSQLWRPMGNTPLYYAMSEALKAFRAVPDVPAKHLIVITDGNNEVYGTPDWLKSFRARTGKQNFDADQIGILLRDQFPDVEVSVLGIALPSFRGKEPINALAKRKIQFYTVSRQVELIGRIETALGLGTFAVQDARKRFPAVAQRIPRVCTVSQWDRAEEFEVSMPDWKPVPQPARLLIEGGEAFELALDPDANRLVHHRYAPPERHPTAVEASDAHVSALYPERQEDRVTFPIAVQNLDASTFSPRPVGVWATITPLRTANGEVVGPAYQFMDRQFESKTPVPVLNFTINSWPREANWAQVELWYRVAKELDTAFADISPDHEIDLSNPRPLDEFAVEGLPGVSFSLRLEPTETGDGVRVIVEERYDGGTAELQHARIECVPPADRVVRSVNRDGGLARHVFEYYGAINRPKRMLLTSRQHIQQAYSSLPKPLSVKLPPRD